MTVAQEAAMPTLAAGAAARGSFTVRRSRFMQRTHSYLRLLARLVPRGVLAEIAAAFLTAPSA